MRIVIDMQGAQSESRFRGIGRYTMSFVEAVIRNRGKHEIILVLNDMFADTVLPITEKFNKLIGKSNIRVWEVPGPVRLVNSENRNRNEIAELLYESFIESLNPDLVHICSLFEGYGDDAISSIGKHNSMYPVSVSFYDLIPLANPDEYLKTDEKYAYFYNRRLEHLKRASLYLAISESAKNECLNFIPTAKEKIFNVSSAIEPFYKPTHLNKTKRSELKKLYNIKRKFFFYTGGADKRKNLFRLLEAYARINDKYKAQFQLVLSGRFPEGNLREIRSVALKEGLNDEQLIFTGFVSEQVLISLYNSCFAFIFPSWHEGFGLPVLEAMACGAPTIASNTSSIPEILNIEQALFDPFDVSSISKKMIHIIEDNELRTDLANYGPNTAKQFTWEKTAKKAISAWESLSGRKSLDYYNYTFQREKLFDALASKVKVDDHAHLRDIASCLCQNYQSGIERQLFIDVSEISNRDSATGVQRVVRSYLNFLLKEPPSGFRVEPVYATSEGQYQYARSFTSKFLNINNELNNDTEIRWNRGDIFFGLDMQHHVQLGKSDFYQKLRKEGVTVKFLVYDLLPIQLSEYFYASELNKYHCEWLSMIALLDEAICISKATKDSLDSWISTNNIPKSPNFVSSVVRIGADIKNSNPSTGLPPEWMNNINIFNSRPTFLCVGTLEPRKKQIQVLKAVDTLWRIAIDINLVFIGKRGWKVDSLIESIFDHKEYGKRLFWLEAVSDEYLDIIYANCTCLIAASENEGFGLPVVEAAQHGIPLIIRDIPVFREIAGEGAFYFTGVEGKDLAGAVEDWLILFHKKIHPKPDIISWDTWHESTENIKSQLISQNYPKRQLLVDITELVQQDAKTGIQRVVRNFLREVYFNPPEGFRIEPIYTTSSANSGYYYARRFTQKYLDCNYLRDDIFDSLIEFGPGDIFFGLDFQPQLQTMQKEFYKRLRQKGVEVKFMLYDLLPIEFPEYFPPGTSEGFSQWLNVISENDGLICISETTANKYIEYYSDNGLISDNEFSVNWSHIGFELEVPEMKTNLSDISIHQNLDVKNRYTFLMVGTLEPRKGHALVISAFEKLWKQGLEINLVIIGKQGWEIDDLIDRISTHPKINTNLFWLKNIDNNYLEYLYTNCSCLINASYGEGFGLPLIEAANYSLPIIASDLQVFHEIGGENIYYFDNSNFTNLSSAIIDWLELYKSKDYPDSSLIKFLSWKESVDNTLRFLIH